jgi:uncharacterized protein (DUF305 family)
MRVATHDTPDIELDESQWFASDTLVAPSDAVPLQPERVGGGDEPPPPDEPRDASTKRGPSWAQVIALVLAVAFLGGAVGYVIGKGRPPSNSSVDVGFLQDMIDHHEQAVEMARITLDKPDVNPVVRGFAEEIVLLQQREIGLMDAQLDAWGKVRGDLDRQAMGWMGMVPTSVQTMPGMQSDDTIAALRAASGADADRLFLTMMRDHHRGGVHMAEYASEHAGSSRVRNLASMMARVQSGEIDEYTGVLRQLGLES